jgi:hypothetical protein
VSRQQHFREIIIDFLRRLLGGDPQDTRAEIQSGAVDGSAQSGAVPTGKATETPPTPRRDAAACPYCGVLLDPAPERGRLCPRCRRRIVVRRVDGRRVLLTEQALGVFEAERDRDILVRTWTAERHHWLELAKGISAPANRITHLGSVPPSEAVVASSKDLYMAAAEHAARTARRDKRWEMVAMIRREQAAALYHAGGSVIPPPDEVVALHRAWSAAALHSLASFGAQVELVATGCCAICSRDSGRAFRIAAELRAERLPHAGCPKGLCGCDWWPVGDVKAKSRRVRRKAGPGTGSVATPAAEAGPDPAAGPGLEESSPT